MEVWVRKDHDGSVHSMRRLQGPEDLQVVQGLGDSMGMEEASMGLLMEALRQEALLQTILYASEHSGILDEEKVQSAVEGVLSKLQKEVLTRIVQGTCEAFLRQHSENIP